MDSIVAILIICLLLINLIAVIFLIKRKQPDQIDNSQIFKDEVMTFFSDSKIYTICAIIRSWPMPHLKLIKGPV